MKKADELFRNEKHNVLHPKTSFWLYVVAGLFIMLVFTTSVFKPTLKLTVNDLSWMIAFAEVSGTLYALVAAFTILNSLNNFTKIGTNVKKETVVLKDIYVLCTRFHQKERLRKLKGKIMRYMDSTIDAFWRHTVTKDVAERDFDSLLETIDEFHAKNRRDITNAEILDEEIMNLLVYRAETLSSLSTKTPIVLWILLIWLSGSLVIAFLTANFDMRLFAILAPTSFAIAVMLVIAAVNDLDNPTQPGFWMVTPTQYLELRNFLNKR